jgi:GT2 family glycosyltransferase
MGAGVPNVCTTIAAEGMGIVDGVHALVADNPRAFADAIVSLYTDEKLWRRISANGRALVQEKFGDAANRASFLSALNDARALPIPLLIEHCNKSAPISFPVYDPAIVPDVSIVVPVYNKWGLTRACLNSIALTCADSDARYEVILADDGSTDETTKAATIFPSLLVVKTPSNLGFLRNCNNAATHARGRYILLLNNDTIVLPGWLKTLYQAMEADPEIAIAGSKLLYPDGKVQEAGGALFRDGSAINVGRGLERDAPAVGIARTVDYISGASILIRSDFWKLVGGFDERYKNAYCEDSDLAMSARAHGMVVRYEPASEVIHFEHQSYVDETSPQNLARTLQKDNTAILHEKWGEVFRQDHVPPHEYKRAAGDAARPIPPSAPARKSGTTSSNSARSPSPFK